MTDSLNPEYETENGDGHNVNESHDHTPGNRMYRVSLVLDYAEG